MAFFPPRPHSLYPLILFMCFLLLISYLSILAQLLLMKCDDETGNLVQESSHGFNPDKWSCLFFAYHLAVFIFFALVRVWLYLSARREA